MSRPIPAVTRALARIVAALTVTVAALLLGAAPASAHTRLLSSDPADGAGLADAPTRVSLLFNEAIEPEFATVTVVGPDGTQYQTGSVSTSGGEVAVAVSPLGPAGVYQVGYRVVSDDGHPVQGAVSFTLTAPGPGAAAPTTAVAAPTAPSDAAPTVAPRVAAEPGQSEGSPTWLWLIGGLVAAGAGGAGVLMALRRGRGVRR